MNWDEKQHSPAAPPHVHPPHLADNPYIDVQILMMAILLENLPSNRVCVEAFSLVLHMINDSVDANFKFAPVTIKHNLIN